MTELADRTDLLRHTLRTIQYRMNGVLDGASPDFASFAVGKDARTPLEILSHIADLLSWSNEQVLPGSFTFEPRLGDWREQIERYQTALFSLASALSKTGVSGEMRLRLLQGPLADVLTHVGQLAMLRGLSGAPVPGQMFFEKELPDVVAAH